MFSSRSEVVIKCVLERVSLILNPLLECSTRVDVVFFDEFRKRLRIESGIQQDFSREFDVIRDWLTEIQSIQVSSSQARHRSIKAVPAATDITEPVISAELFVDARPLFNGLVENYNAEQAWLRQALRRSNTKRDGGFVAGSINGTARVRIDLQFTISRISNHAE